jgi:hypothetical protein
LRVLSIVGPSLQPPTSDELSKKDSVCQLLKKFFAKSRGQQGLSSYLPFLFENKYIRTKGILKHNGKFLEGISFDQKGGVGTPLIALVRRFGVSPFHS